MRNIIKNIVKSRLEYNKTLTVEQKERLKICSNCPLNSANQKNKTFKTKVMIIINKILDKLFGVEDNEENICTKCGCNLKHKTSQAEEKCPKELWK